MNSLAILLSSVFYIFSATLQQYLTTDGEGRPTLSATPSGISLTYNNDTGMYTVQGAASQWFIRPAGTTGQYHIACPVSDANAMAFVYASNVATGQLATTYTEPDAGFSAGLWTIATNDMELANIALDEDNTTCTAPTTGKTLNVTLRRRLVAGEWNTLCLPFGLSDAQVKDTWGEGAAVARYTAFDDAKGATFTPTTEGIVAGEPCLLLAQRVSNDDTYSFSGVSPTEWAATPKAVTHDNWTYTGSYTFIHPVSGTYVFGSGSLIYRVPAEAKVNLRGFRAYFVSTGAQPSQAAWHIGGTATDIDVPTISPDAPADIYRMDGTLVRRRATTTRDLAPGVYLANGKKIIIK